MESSILKKDHADLILLYKMMTPEERLVAFLNHSRLVHIFYQAGLDSRKKSRNNDRKKQN